MSTPGAAAGAAPEERTSVWLGWQFAGSEKPAAVAFKDAVAFQDGNPPGADAEALRVIAEPWKGADGDMLLVTRQEAEDLLAVVQDFASYEALFADDDPERRWTVNVLAAIAADLASVARTGSCVFAHPPEGTDFVVMEPTRG